MSLALARILILMLPATALFLLHICGQHSARQRSAALFAGLWCGLSTLCLGAFYGHVLWQAQTDVPLFNISGAALYGVPVDLPLACGLVMAACLLAAGTQPIKYALAGLFCAGFTVACFGMFSAASTPALIALSTAAAVPALLLGFWTARDSHVYARSFVQAVVWCVLLLWLLPATALSQTGRGWAVLWSHPLWMYLPFALTALLMAHALYVFARHGDGTGFPYDPPKRLVTAGAYAYVSNPMQISICLAMAWWGVLLDSGTVILCGPIALLLFIVFKDVCNGSSNLCGADAGFVAYQAAVPRWWPRRTAYIPPTPNDAAPQGRNVA